MDSCCAFQTISLVRRTGERARGACQRVPVGLFHPFRQDYSIFPGRRSVGDSRHTLTQSLAETVGLTYREACRVTLAGQVGT